MVILLKRILLLSVALVATLQVFAQDVQYMDADGNKKTASAGSYTRFTGQTTLDGGWYVVDSDVTLNTRINIAGTVHLILTDGHTLTAKNGICLNEHNELDIYGQGGGTGTLNATGQDYQAGIGGDNHQHAGTLIVNGGSVNATAGYSAAGIGGGAQGYWAGTYGHGGTVIINGGKVTATGSGYGAGIGGGGNHIYSANAIPGKGGVVIINGGQVTATGGSDGGYGIGPGKSSGNEGETGTLSLGWRNQTDRIFMSSVKAEVTLKSEFLYEDTKEVVTADNLDGRTIISSDTSAPSDRKLKGDVNDDGSVDISDVVATINHIAGTAVFKRADVNKDSRVDISDVVAIINIIANGIKEYEDENTDPETPEDPAVKAGLCPDEHHPHVIDMGDAGKWSCCNIGASAPWEHGGYYAWGETEVKDFYGLNSYSHCDGSTTTMHDLGGNISGTDYDVAHVKWGSEWRMPSSDNWKQFSDKCSGEPFSLNGVWGMLFTGPEGARVFLPATGLFMDDYIFRKDQRVYCWSSNPSTTGDIAFAFQSDDEGTIPDQILNKYFGLPVRPVFGKDSDYAVAQGWCPDENHPHVIDMGAAGKWSCCNVGASTPLEFGGYYAWGETEEKDCYDLNTYTLCDGSSETMRYLGFDISGSDYDVAHVKWGGRWQIPDHDQIQSLLDNCTAKYVTIKGVGGLKIEAVDGSTLFLPGAGERWDGDLKYSMAGSYWTSTLWSEFFMESVFCLHFSAYSSAKVDMYSRINGKPVRPVIEEDDDKPNLDPAVAQGYCPDAFHPHVIDMGAAGKWSCCNVGAYAPWNFGNFYAWGETEKKDSYSYNNYTHCDGSSETMHDIGNDIAGTDYDVAHVKWGGSWQMPNRNQLQLLLDNCTLDYIEFNKVAGIRFRESGGGMLFLPAEGYRWEDGWHSDFGYYWSSTLEETDNQKDAYFLFFNQYNNYSVGDYERSYGFPVRPIAK